MKRIIRVVTTLRISVGVIFAVGVFIIAQAQAQTSGSGSRTPGHVDASAGQPVMHGFLSVKPATVKAACDGGRVDEKPRLLDVTNNSNRAASIHASAQAGWVGVEMLRDCEFVRPRGYCQIKVSINCEALAGSREAVATGEIMIGAREFESVTRVRVRVNVGR